jgi:hypothetical protein
MGVRPVELEPDDVIVLVLAAGVSLGVVVAVVVVGLEATREDADWSAVVGRLFDLAQMMTIGVLAYLAPRPPRR